MKNSGYMCIWIYNVFILPEEYWWIGCGRTVPKFYSGSFGDVLFWFIRGHSDRGMTRTSDVHKKDFLGLVTSIWQVMFCSVQSGSICSSLILSSNIICTWILVKWLSAFCYMHSASAYVTYWVLCLHLFLHCRWYYRYLR